MDEQQTSRPNDAPRSLNDLAKEIHQAAIDKGWYEEERTFPEFIALAHSELSEALEAWREKKPWVWPQGKKPEGAAVELVDCIIRILDTLEYMCPDIDIDGALADKMAYNKTRPHRHGGKRA